MIFLVILVYFILCTLLFDVKIEKKASNFIFFSQFLCLVLLFGLRYRVGGDSLFYQDAYLSYFKLDELGKVNLFDQFYQPLWYILNAITRSITNDFTLFQFVHTIIINGSIFYLINKYCEKRFLGVLFYYVFYCLYFNTEILRESLAVVIFAFAYPLLNKKKYIAYFILCFAAYMIHAFAVICFIFPFLIHLFRKPIKVYHLIFISLLLLVVPMLILDFVIKFAGFNKFILVQMEHYTKLEVNINGIILTLFQVIPILIVMFIQAKNPNANKMLIPVVNLYFVFVLMSVTLAGAYRVSNYFIIFYYFAVLECVLFIFSQANIRNYIAVGGSLVLLLMINIFYYYFKDVSQFYYGREAKFYNRYYPYHSIFDPQKDLRRETIFRKVMEAEPLKTK